MQLVNGLKKCMDYLIYYKQDLVIRRGYRIWPSDDVTVKYQFPWEVQSSWFRPVNEPLHRMIHVIAQLGRNVEVCTFRLLQAAWRRTTRAARNFIVHQ